MIIHFDNLETQTTNTKLTTIVTKTITVNKPAKEMKSWVIKSTQKKKKQNTCKRKQKKRKRKSEPKRSGKIEDNKIADIKIYIYLIISHVNCWNPDYKARICQTGQGNKNEEVFKYKETRQGSNTCPLTDKWIKMWYFIYMHIYIHTHTNTHRVTFDVTNHQKITTDWRLRWLLAFLETSTF